ncbi:MAG: hypothetical protein H8E22_02880 [Candidatus Cloacimonetes bacterium]|nr:hypothetical protein [Candidatus Cloacimonadota bacterium]
MTDSKRVEPINSLFIAGLEFQETLEKRNWPFCFIGGLAVLRWGEIRMTQDIDLCLLCGFGNEEKYIKTLLKKFKSRITNAEDFAFTNRVLLLYTSNRVSIDISLSGIPFEDQMIKRATAFSFHTDCKLITCSAEDLIILKSFANRTKDWMDVEGIILRQGKSLDTHYIMEQLAPLCEIKGTPDIVIELQDLIKRAI